jgi:hypothetical protein
MSIEYTTKDIEGKIRFSPSGFASFYENPRVWYKNTILKDNSFKGNTNTVIGSIIHKRIENYFNGLPTNTKEEQDYIDSYNDIVEVDGWRVADDVNNIWEVLQIELPTMDKPTSMEQKVEFHIPNSDCFIYGTYDYMRGDVLGDIKTTSVTPKAIKVAHRIQLLLYNLALQHSGITNIRKMEVMYIVKLKKEPKVVILQEDIQDHDMEWIKQEVKNMVKRVELVLKDKELEDIVFPNNPDSYIS